LRISVSDTGLGRALRRFKPRPNAKIEFNVNSGGVDIVANGDGWLTLARWCLLMAHQDMDGWGAGHWHARDTVMNREMMREGRAIMSFEPLVTEYPGQDVYFHRSESIGEDFWQGRRATGNSPMSAVALELALSRVSNLFGCDRASAEEVLGAPVAQRTHGGFLTAVYSVDDFPGGKLEIDYGPDGLVTGIGT